MKYSRFFTAAAGILGTVLWTGCHPAFADEAAIPPPPRNWRSITPTTYDVPKTPYAYELPQDLSDGWEVGDLRAEKVDMDKIVKGVEQCRMRVLLDVHNLMIVRHGRILLDEYFDRQGPQDGQQMHSCAKAVFTTVYGIAQDQGLLKLDDKIFGDYPDARAKAGWDKQKDAITVGMLLSMTSGLEDDSDAVTGTDWLSYCFGLKQSHPPGTVWNYSGTCLTLLTDQIEKKSGMSYPQYADKYLLAPLGIQNSEWLTDPQGNVRVDDGLSWTPRDMAKLGQLYLNKGLWNGKRIVSEAWLKAATTVHTAPPGAAWGHDYGYLWHIKTMRWKGRPVQVFYASGWRGQKIFVSPDADLVCVMTAENFEDFPKFHVAEEDFFENMVLGSFDRPDADTGLTADIGNAGGSNPSPETAPASADSGGNPSPTASPSVAPPHAGPTPDIGAGLPIYDLNAPDVDKAGGPYQDTIGSKFSYTLAANPHEKGSKYFKIDYDLLADGFCGYWFHTGGDWNGQDWTGGKDISFMIYSKHSLTLVLALEDKNHNQYTAHTVPTRGTGWERLVVPLDSFHFFKYYTPPGAIKGAPEDLSAVYDLNFGPATVGKNSFAMGDVFLVK